MILAVFKLYFNFKTVLKYLPSVSTGRISRMARSSRLRYLLMCIAALNEEKSRKVLLHKYHK